MFDKVVFAGGGHRCWWQAGFWEQLSGEIELHPRVIGGVSAGAATACLLYANDSKRALAWYERELKGLRSNINWFNLVRPGERLMPHAAIYRKALRALLGGENYRQLMWRAPEIRIQYSRLPSGMGPRRAMLRGMLAYNVEKYWHGSLHPNFGQRLGFTQEVKRVQDCRSERELVDLLVASSCTPPFTPVETIDGLPCLDGGLMDSVPIGTVADVPGQTLVLTTRRYKSLAPVFARNGLVYVQPSRKVAASSWDYTSPAKFQQTYDLGRRDAVAFLETFGLGRYQDVIAHLQSAGAIATPAGVSGGVSDGVSDGVKAGVVLDDAAADDTVAADTAIPWGVRSRRAGPEQAESEGAESEGEGREGEGREGAEGEGAGRQGPGSVRSGSRNAAAEAVVPDGGATVAAMTAGSMATGAGPEDHAEMRATDATLPEGDEPDPEVFEPMSSLDDKPSRKVLREEGVLDVNARLADYREPNEAGIAEDLSASQPAASDGHDRSGRSLRASRI